MELSEAKLRFIDIWGNLATQWGINKTMAQLHAFLLVSAEPMCTDDMMEELHISRGNVNMNVRELMDWGLVRKTILPGKRKDFYIAEKDMNVVAKKILIQRKRRELEPLVEQIEGLSKVGGQKSKEKEEFVNMMEAIGEFGNKTNDMLDRLVKLEENKLMRSIWKLIR